MRGAGRSPCGASDLRPIPPLRKATSTTKSRASALRARPAHCRTCGQPPGQSAIQTITIRYSAIQCIAPQCSTMKVSATQCSAVQFSQTQCSAMQYNAVQCITVQCSAVLTVQCSSAQCNTVQCSAVQHNAADIFRQVHILLCSALLLTIFFAARAAGPGGSGLGPSKGAAAPPLLVHPVRKPKRSSFGKNKSSRISSRI